MSNEAKHTEEKLTVQPEQWSEGRRLVLCSKDDIIAVVDPGLDAEMPSDLDWANACRLAACWNACRGIPTTDLKADKIQTVLEHTQEVINDLMDAGRELQAQRDALLAAMRNILTALRTEDDPHLCDRLGAIANAVLTQVEGKK